MNHQPVKTVSPLTRPVTPRLLARVLVVHASDTKVRGRLEPIVIGTGLVPYRDIFSRLKRSGFDKWISIEEASGTGADGVRRAVEFVKKTWEEA